MASTAATPAKNPLETDLTKYKTAAEIVNNVLKKLVESAVEGAKVSDIILQGDQGIEAGTGAVYNKKGKAGSVPKGIAFPTTVSVNNTVSNFAPLSNDPGANLTLAKGDVVKIRLGAHIDGFAAISGETLIVGATESEPATGRAADVVTAAYTAAEAAMRTLKVGEKNTAVNDIVDKVSAVWGCKPVENISSYQFEQNKTNNFKKRILLNPGEQERRDLTTFVFGENEVYGLSVLVSSTEDGKCRPEETRATIYQKSSEVTYQLKLKTSRAVFSEAQGKSGAFPFNVRWLEDQTRSRLGLQEAIQHNLVQEFHVEYTAAGTYVAEFFFTIALLPSGPTLITQPPVWYKPEKVKASKELEDGPLKELITKPLRESKKAKKKRTTRAEGDEDAE